MKSYQIPFARWAIASFLLSAVVVLGVGVWLAYRYSQTGTIAQVLLISAMTLFSCIMLWRFSTTEPTSVSLDSGEKLAFRSRSGTTERDVADLKKIVKFTGPYNLCEASFLKQPVVRFRGFPDLPKLISDLRELNPRFDCEIN